MEKNEVLLFNNILYRLYEADSFILCKKTLLNQLRRLIPYAYASILMSDMNLVHPMLEDPICVPDTFLKAENKYISMADKDHTLWIVDSGQPVVICESKVMTEHKRLLSPIYQECYKEYGIFDTLQVSIAYNNVFLGILTLYRTRKEGAFTDDDVFFMSMAGTHLNRLFYHYCIEKDNVQLSPEKIEPLKEQYQLTKRECEVLLYVYAGKGDGEIAEILGISLNTLKKHFQHIYQKIGVSSKWDLLKFKP